MNPHVPFESIEDSLDRLLRDPIPLLVLNSDSTDELDYDTVNTGDASAQGSFSADRDEV